MRHSVHGRGFSRNKNERKRLFSGLVRAFFLKDVMVTTLAKAKAVQPMIDQLITRAKKGKASDMRLLLRVIPDKDIVKRLMQEAKTRFAGRNSGYTRIVKLGMRTGDATETAQLSFVDERVETSIIAPVKEGTTEEKSKKIIKQKTVKKSAKK